MENFFRSCFFRSYEVKTNVSALVIYWFQNTYFIHFIRLAPIFLNRCQWILIGFNRCFLEHSEHSEHSEVLTSNF